ncbi:MAG: hypothetical protein ACTSVI_03180, partial [Promethearchaeota archaeon]
MKQEDISSIIIFTKHGIPIVMYDLTEDKLLVEPALISGFLSAIEQFSGEIFNKDSSYFSIEYGGKKISIFRNPKDDSVAITTFSRID